MIISRDEFLKWELESKDIIDVKKIYIDITEDLVSGVLLSQIIFWNLPTRDKKKHTKCIVKTKGEDGQEKYWVAKKRSDWWDECRLTERQVDRAVKILLKKGLIEVMNKKFQGTPQLHIHFKFSVFFRLWQEQMSKDNSEGAYQSYKKRADVVSRNIEKGKKNDPEFGLALVRQDGVGLALVRQDDLPYQGKTFNIDYNIDNKEKRKRNASAERQGSTGYASESLAAGASWESENNIDIESTSESSPARSGGFWGLEFHRACQNFFADDYSKVLYFIQNMTVDNDKQLHSFIRYAADRYDRTVFLTVLSQIEDRFVRGEIARYTPTYVFNALDRAIENNDREDDMSMQRVRVDFKTFCINKFGTEDGMEVYHFYRNTLSTKKESRADASSINERRTKNIEWLTKECGTDPFLKTMRWFREGHENGTLNTRSMKHFSNCVKKIAKPKEARQPQPGGAPAEAPMATKQIVKPIMTGKRLETQYSGKWEYHNWEFSCSCGAIFDSFQKACPNCGSPLDWSEPQEKSRMGVLVDEHRTTRSGVAS